MNQLVVNNQSPIPPGANQDALLGQVLTEFNDKGYVVANLDKLVNWVSPVARWK